MKKNILVLAALALSGCSAIPSVDITDPNFQKISEFEPSPTKAALYVFRDRNSAFGVTMLDLSINDEDVITYPSCYTRIELEPGNYHLEADHPDMMGFEQELDISVNASDILFYEFKPIARLGIPGESKLIPHTIDKAKKKIKEQQLCTIGLVTI